MTQPLSTSLKNTALYAQHLAGGARMIPHAGWNMPGEYAGLAVEHLAVRTAAGLFDLSDVGQIELAGRDAVTAMQWLTCNDVSRLEPGQLQGSALLSPAGTFVDDLMVYRLADRHFMLVVNGGHITEDVAWIVEHARRFGDVITLDNSARYALLALQGPAAEEVLQRVTNFDLSAMKYYGFGHGEVAGVRATLSRFGSTGEDGFEVFVPPKQATTVWSAILEAGSDRGVTPAGLGARDTLRLEAGIPVHGTDIGAETTALEAGLERIVAWDKGDFLGRDGLKRQKETGITKRLVGFEVVGGAIAQQGNAVVINDQRAGVVTSGAHAPFLKKAIGMAYLPTSHNGEGAVFDVDINGQLSRARVVRLPFYQRPKG